MECGLIAASASTIRDLSIFTPASPAAASIRDLSLLIFAISGLIFVVVEGVLLYCVYRFRRGAPTQAAEPPQVYGSKSIEVAWTVAPALIVFTILLVTTRTLWEVEFPPPEPQPGDQALYVTVIGRQWWWEFMYTHFDGRRLDFTTANELHVPASVDGVPRRIYLTLKSADVCHSFWVPRLAGKTDLIPGRTNHMWFEAEAAELFVGQCAEYCGTQHAQMLLRVVAEPLADFETWLAAESQPAAATAAASEGKAVFMSQSCVNCHRIRGTPAAGTYAPDLTHLMGRETLAAGIVPNTAAELRRWVDNPQQIKPGCLMPAFGLSERENELIVDYLLSLH